MSSPVSIPFKSLIRLDDSGTPIYLQISRQLINAIQRGVIPPGARLPGSRTLSSLLQLHRKTVIAAMEELDAQGWLVTKPNVGTFVTDKPPVAPPHGMPNDLSILAQYPTSTGYKFPVSNLLDRPVPLEGNDLEITDGQPDIRIAPMDKLAKTYRGILTRKSSRKLLGYSYPEGNPYFLQQLADYLNTTRGLHVKSANVLATRGIQMGLFLTSTLLLQPGDLVVVGSTSHYVGNMIFQHTRARIETVPVDEQGISVEALRKLCTRKKIRMLYLTPHHHYPTTVTLSADRRVEILQLAQTYGFIILEDDHDYDFHFNSSPLLPLASADSAGMVVYVGSFCKALSPGLRQGYVVAPENLIRELAKLRRIVDRQGDLVMEQAMAELLKEGEIQRHLKKALKIYQARKDLFCNLLVTHFGSDIRFQSPPGGLAVWLEWTVPVNLLRTSQRCYKRGLTIPQTLLFQNENISAMRLGFGNLNEAEIEEALQILKDSVC